MGCATENSTEDAAAAAKSCPTLCDPIDSSPPGSSVPGILQARILEWVAVSFSQLKLKPRQILEAEAFQDMPPWRKELHVVRETE